MCSPALSDGHWNEFRKRGLPTYNLARSSGALASPYPFVLYSDLYVHRDLYPRARQLRLQRTALVPEVRDAVSEKDLIRRPATAWSSLRLRW